MDSEPFLAPRLVGQRFEGHTIPLELLRDLAVLEEMVIEVAKWRYLQEHPNRSRCPRGFSEGVYLSLSSIEEGSAIAAIALFFGIGYLTPPSKQVYYEQGRESIVGAISAAEAGRSVTEHLPPKILTYFDRLGRSLRDGEAMEFPTGGADGPAKLTKESRRRLILASEVEELTEEILLRGKIPAASQDTMTFHIKLQDDTRVLGPITQQHFDTIMDAFNGFRQGVKVQLNGVGKFNRSNKLQEIQSIEHIMILDPLDIPSRFDELKALKDGWLDGLGRAPSAAGLDWLAKRFEEFYSDALPLPYVYPVAEGGIQFEWSIKPVEASLEIDFEDRIGRWHALDLDTDQEDVDTFRLDDREGWDGLVGRLERLNGAKA